MSTPDPVLARLVREALEHAGRVDLGTLLARAIPIAELRAMAQEHGLSPKGFRIERTPAAKLVPLLLDAKRPEVLEATCRALLARLDAPRQTATDASLERSDADALLALRTRENAELRTEMERLRLLAAEWRDRESALNRRALEAESRAARTRAELDAALARSSRRTERGPSKAPDLERRLREIEKERDDLLATEAELRRLVALRQARIRELDERVQELVALVPSGKRRKTEAAVEPALADEFRLPYFQPSFYKSLADKDRRAIEQAVQAALLFCTEGHAYPGLEVKPIEGQDLWSLRASIKLRVYFRHREDGGVDFLEVADREDQHTALRRLKEK
ncbi:MAG: hypothetical protein IT457_10710 [Planctomycetes bacterium]|nr:hypothetical protein [Planctomycetota bacterium]